MADDRHRCRWHTDGPPGRCPHPQAFPGVADAPPFCMHHLHMLEPWVAQRAVQRSAGAQAWIAWARRRAADVQAMRRMLGERGGTP